MPRSSAGGPVIAVLASALIAALIAAAVWWLMTGRGGDPEPRSATTGPQVTPIDDSSATDPKPGEPYAVSFRRHMNSFEACTNQHRPLLAGRSKLDFIFQIETDGTVQKVSLSPAEIAGGELGACLLEVARGVRFAAGESPVTIKIPLHVRPG